MNGLMDGCFLRWAYERLAEPGDLEFWTMPRHVREAEPEVRGSSSRDVRFVIEKKKDLYHGIFDMIYVCMYGCMYRS